YRVRRLKIERADFRSRTSLAADLNVDDFRLDDFPGAVMQWEAAVDIRDLVPQCAEIAPVRLIKAERSDPRRGVADPKPDQRPALLPVEMRVHMPRRPALVPPNRHRCGALCHRRQLQAIGRRLHIMDTDVVDRDDQISDAYARLPRRENALTFQRHDRRV